VKERRGKQGLGGVDKGKVGTKHQKRDSEGLKKREHMRRKTPPLFGLNILRIREEKSRKDETSGRTSN